MGSLWVPDVSEVPGSPRNGWMQEDKDGQAGAELGVTVPRSPCGGSGYGFAGFCL